MFWTESYSAMKVAAQHKDALIHFSHMNKLGVNPRKTHRDPPGIYFYPIRWLFNIDEVGYSQYGHHFEYYYICKIKPGAKMLYLRKMSIADVRKVATKNGWIEDFNRVAAEPKLMDKIRPNNATPKMLRKAGYLFYSVMDYLVNIEGKSWLSLLRGWDGIFDTIGAVTPDEPQQVIVFKLSNLQIIAQGENKDESSKMYAEAVKKVADEFGGKFYYKHKIPSADFMIDNKPITLMYDWGNYRLKIKYVEDGLWTAKNEKLHSSSDGSVESEYSTLKFYLKTILQKAESNPIETYWNKNNFTLFMTVAPRLYRSAYQGVRDGSSYIRGSDSSGGTYLLLNITTQKNGQMNFEFELLSKTYLHNDDGEAEETPIQLKFEQTYSSNSDVKTVAREFFEWVNNLEKPKRNYILKYLGFVTD